MNIQENANKTEHYTILSHEMWWLIQYTSLLEYMQWDNTRKKIFIETILINTETKKQYYEDSWIERNKRWSITLIFDHRWKKEREIYRR